MRMANALAAEGWTVTVACVRPLNLVYRWRDDSLRDLVSDRVTVYTVPDSGFALPPYLDWLGPVGLAAGTAIRAAKTILLNLMEALIRPRVFWRIRSLVSRGRYPALRMDYRWTCGVVQLARVIHAEQPITGILATMPPHFSSVTARVVSEELDVPYGMDFQDRWVGNPYLSIGKHAAALQEELLAGAAAVYTASNPLKVDLTASVPVQVTRLPIGFDPAMWPNDTTYRRSSSAGGLTLIHAGTMYESTRPLLLSCAIEQLALESVTAHFVGDTTPDFIKKTRHLAPHIQHRDIVVATEARRLVAEADIGVAFETGAPEAVPAKIFDYLGARKPTIWVGRDDHEAAEILRECGLLIGTGTTAEELVSVLESAVRHWQTGEPLTQPRDSAIEQYSIARIGASFTRTMSWASGS